MLFLCLYICLFECGIKINYVVYWLLVLRQAGMVLNKGRTRGKMECWVPTVLSLQTLITLTSFKLRIRLGRSHISHQLYCTKLLEGLEDLMCMRDLWYQSLFQILMEISLCLLVIGIKPATRWAGYNIFFFVYTHNILLNTAILYRNGILYVHLTLRWLHELFVLVLKFTLPVYKVSYNHF